MELIVTNELAELERLHAGVAQFCRENQLAAELEGEAALAVEEIVVNVMRYGYPEGGKHEILVRLFRRHGEVTIEVEDDGVAFNPLAAAPPELALPMGERPVGGLGIHLVKSLMEVVEYRREGGRNHLTMRKRVAESGSPES